MRDKCEACLLGCYLRYIFWPTHLVTAALPFSCLLLLQCANLDAFDTERSISLVPPDGEFALANYRTSHGLRPPFRLSIITEPDMTSDMKVRLG